MLSKGCYWISTLSKTIMNKHDNKVAFNDKLFVLQEFNARDFAEQRTYDHVILMHYLMGCSEAGIFCVHQRSHTTSVA